MLRTGFSNNCYPATLFLYTISIYNKKAITLLKLPADLEKYPLLEFYTITPTVPINGDCSSCQSNYESLFMRGNDLLPTTAPVSVIPCNQL